MTSTSPMPTLVHLNGVDLNAIAVRSPSEAAKSLPALVFHHYWGGSHRTWLPLIQLLLPHFHCITYDVRGWGASSKNAVSHTLEDMAEDMIAIATHFGLAETEPSSGNVSEFGTGWIAVGHSMGAKVVQLVGSKHPSGLLALALVGSSPPSPQPLPDELRLQLAGFFPIIDQAISSVMAAMIRTTLSEETIQMVKEDTLSCTEASWTAWPMTNMVLDITDSARKITVPVLVVASESDPIDPVDSMRSLILPVIAHAMPVVIKASGHLIPLEATSDLSAAILNFALQMRK